MTEGFREQMERTRGEPLGVHAAREGVRADLVQSENEKKDKDRDPNPDNDKNKGMHRGETKGKHKAKGHRH